MQNTILNYDQNDKYKELLRIAKSRELFYNNIESYQDLLENLDCSQIKKILNYSVLYYERSELSSSKADEYNHLIELLTYKMVKSSPSFKLINQEKSLTEDDFEKADLLAIKNQFGITEKLDQDNLMRLYFTLKFLGQEASFISAIKPEKKRENPLLNYQLDIKFDELKHLHVLRSEYDLTQEQLCSNRFKIIEEGKIHTCVSPFTPDSHHQLRSKFHALVVDPHPVSAGHYIKDFYSEDFPFPNEVFKGKDVEELRKFARDRQFLIYHCHVIKNPKSHKHHFDQYTKCGTCIGSFLNPKVFLPEPLIKKIDSNLDPRITYQERIFNNLFGYTRYGSANTRDYYIDGEDSILLSNIPGRFAKIKSDLSCHITEANIYLNLSDINGLAFTGNKSLDFIDLFCETELQRKQTLQDPNKLDKEMSKIHWQRGEFCKDVKDDLEKKLAIFEKDLEFLKSDNRATREAILKKYNSPIMGDAWTVCCGPENQIYDENDKLLSMQERAELINPENINYFLQKEIYRAKSDIAYLSQLSNIPSLDQVKAKLSRDLNLYEIDCSKTSLTETIDFTSKIPNFKDLFISGDQAKDENSKEKFKILIERLAVEGFFNEENTSEELKEKRKKIKDQFNEIAIKFDLIMDEFIAQAIALNQSKNTEPSIEFLQDPTPYPPFEYVPLEGSSLPRQIMMSDEKNEDDRAEFASINYELKKSEIQKLLTPYRLQYSPRYARNYFGNWREIPQPKTQEHQLYFNEIFKLDLIKTLDLETDLRGAINHAFEHLPKTLIEYNKACKREKKKDDKGRNIHDGYHALTTSYYAKELLKFYQKNKEFFPEEMQQQIAEFDNPQKIRDLEILSIMHDSARYHDGRDRDEYKNAFYVALMLRNMGDERFQGKEISEEGFKMLMDLANKEEGGEKSLTSKLIQSADSLAIMRCKRLRNGKEDYDFYFNDLYEDLSKITDEKLREIEKARLMVIGNLLLENEQTYKPQQFLEFSEKPFDDFATNIKSQKLSEVFGYKLTHDQDGFNKLLKAGCFKYILQNFSKTDINENFSKSKSYSEYFKSFLLGFENFNDFVIKNSINKINAGDLADLIDLGIDIYSTPITNKTPLAYQIAKGDWKASALDKKLMEYGVLISSNNLATSNQNTEERKMFEFCQKLKEGDAEILQQISQGLNQNIFTSKKDLHEKVQTLTFKNNADEELSISLNGFGLIRILEQNLIQSTSSDLKTSLTKLKTLRDSEIRQPIVHASLNFASRDMGIVEK